jgi:hypothetical protein
VFRGMPETAQALFLKLTKDQRDWFPLEGSFRELWDYLVECTELPHQKRERLAKEKAVEEVQAKWEKEHPPQGYIDAFAAGLATSDQFRGEVAAELAGELDPKESKIMLDDESDRPRLVAEFAGIEGLDERLASDDELRAVVAEMIALGWGVAQR